MSFDRQRAIEVSAESTLSARRPALARAWLVRVINSCSSAALNELALQASTWPGFASRPTLVNANEIETIIDQRRSRAAIRLRRSEPDGAMRSRAGPPARRLIDGRGNARRTVMWWRSPRLRAGPPTQTSP